MENIFVYGTLQQPEVQLKLLGRKLESTNDLLNGFKKGKIKINGTTYFIAIPKARSAIAGKVLKVTSKEIAVIDKYETAAYERTQVRLESGITAWVYRLP